MANTSVDQFLDTLHGVLGFANNTGSVNLYMVHGGTNFGYTAGALPAVLAAWNSNSNLNARHAFCFTLSCSREVLMSLKQGHFSKNKLTIQTGGN